MTTAQLFLANAILILIVLMVCLIAPADAAVQFSCSFENSPTDCGFRLQARNSSRATLVAGRQGRGVRLFTMPGDTNIAGSGDMERADLWLTQQATDGYQGRDQWWAHSMMFPNEFAMPTWQMYVLFDFHNTNPGPGQANFHVNFENGRLIFRGYGEGRAFKADIGPVQRNLWYDFVYHVRWSSGSDGFFDAWVNGVRKLSYQGPTLYLGQGVYLKLANYHTPVCNPYPGCAGFASAVIHDRVIRGTSHLDVALQPLQGMPQ